MYSTLEYSFKFIIYRSTNLNLKNFEIYTILYYNLHKLLYGMTELFI